MKLSAAEHLPVGKIVETHITGRNAYNREKRREQREKTHNNGNLNDVLEKARKVGMSYGKYVAMMDGTPKIWQGEK